MEPAERPVRHVAAWPGGFILDAVERVLTQVMILRTRRRIAIASSTS